MSSIPVGPQTLPPGQNPPTAMLHACGPSVGPERRVPGKRVAILQSNYIPWKGYFDIIRSVDVFVIYDEVQYTKNDWRNRNLIRTANGPQWLTIPVRHESLSQKISETCVADKSWPTKHWKAIVQNYSRARHFKEYEAFLADLYRTCTETNLSKINLRFLHAINRLLNIETSIVWSGDYRLQGDKTERLVDLCKQLQATEYLSGPAAKSYLDQALFQQENISVAWVDYHGYPEYRQVFPGFEHAVSIIDLILNEGANADRYLLRF